MQLHIFDYPPHQPSPDISPEEIHVWKVDCENYFLEKLDLELLTSQEKAQMNQYANSQDRLHYALGHTITKKLLELYTGFPGSSISFSYEDHGKPYWQAADRTISVEFSISHSGRWVILAFSQTYVLGIDVEEIRSTPRLDSMARRCFHPSEWDSYQNTPLPSRLLYFYQHWTSKEALLKGLGTGLTHSTATFYIEEIPDDSNLQNFQVHSPESSLQTWRIVSLPLEPPYAASLAWALK